VTTLLISLDHDPERADEVIRLLRIEMAPWMRQQQGFVSSHWFLADNRRAGSSETGHTPYAFRSARRRP
jgi:hypothetical protein